MKKKHLSSIHIHDKNSQQCRSGGKCPQLDKEYLQQNLQLELCLMVNMEYFSSKIKN